MSSICVIILRVWLGASVSLSVASKRGRKSLVSIRFFGCRPMSAWALLAVSVELPKCAAFTRVSEKFLRHSFFVFERLA